MLCCVAPLSRHQVKEALGHVGLTETELNGNVVFRQGWFNVTMLEPIPDAISLLHIDCDWYECTMDAFRRFYSRIDCGGIVILDDYGFLKGQRQAFYDFVFEADLNPFPFTFGKSLAAYFEKQC